MVLRLLAHVITASAVAASIATADETDRPPNQGGFTHQMGIPSLMRTTFGAEYQSYKPAGEHELGGLFNVGVMHYLGHPIVGLGGLGLEIYAGGRAYQPDFGARAYFTIPTMRIGAGMDLNAESNERDFILKLDLPVRRGGIVGAGSAMTVRWIPTRDQTFTVGVSLPFGDPEAGRTRPHTDYVKMDARRPRRLTAGYADDADSLPGKAILTFLGERARWIAELTQPFAEYGGADAVAAMAPQIKRLREHLAAKDDVFPDGHTLNEEIRVYHETLDRAFSIADSGAAIPAGQSTARGRRVCAEARRILLDDVVFRYNYLVGQLKKKDTLSGMVAVAQTNFARWLLSGDTSSDTAIVAADRVRAERHFRVFQSLCEALETNRAVLAERWGSSRLVWLPLQYGLTPQEHDTQEELDRIIERATRREFTAGNRVWYIVNEEFQSEVARSVRAAEDYHVLWIHDVSGHNHHGEPDAIAYDHVCNYLRALTERVRGYDRTGKLPEYIILLDQHYFEATSGRLWMTLLEDPMRHRLRLPKKFARWEAEIARLQEDLRRAVSESVVLQVEKSQYGEDWLYDRVRVHVNITNPADYSFYSWKVIGKLPISDNHMRDHRKIVFYDITEDDPYRGKAMFTGMGLGEHYTGATWEDRALMLEGPAALETKNAARFLLQTQGFRDDQIPFSLRARPKPDSYDAAAKVEVAAQPIYATGRVIELHNETGFTPKPLNVAKAVLYSLMPRGSIIKVPDSLWQSYLYAALMAGSAMRGCRALVIAPSKRAAPSAGAPQMARASGLMKRLLVFGNAMDDYMEREGGILRVGLYAPRQGVGDIAGRMRQAVSHGKSGKKSWKERVYHLNPEVEAVAQDAGKYLGASYQASYLTAKDSLESPKLHLKANFFASARVWDDLMSRPEWAGILEAYIRYLALQQGKSDPGVAARDVRAVPRDLKEKLKALLNDYLAGLSPEQKSEMVCYLTIGSANMDYRSQAINGEVMVTIGGMAGLEGVLDFMLLAGLCDWPGTPEEVDKLLPPPGGLMRRLSSFIKVAL
jgi:hypothetical protein